MRLPERVAVLGLGLMGGSLARDLVAQGIGVLGYDRDPETIRVAESAGLLPLPDPSSPALAGVELVVIAVPVTSALELLARIAPHLPPACVVTDLGSTKRSIGEAAERLGLGDRFVGSHPLAGDHLSGWVASRRGLYAGARVYLCPTPSTRGAVLEQLSALWTALGARPQEMRPEAHDRQLAWTSHLPQIASSLLGGVLASAGYGPERLGPGGRDVTRLAGSSPEMWGAICLDNAEEIGAALAALEMRLAEFRAALARGEAEAITRLLAAGHRWSHGEAEPE